MAFPAEMPRFRDMAVIWLRGPYIVLNGAMTRDPPYTVSREHFSEVCTSIYKPREVGGKVVDEDAWFIALKLTMGNV